MKVFLLTNFASVIKWKDKISFNTMWFHVTPEIFQVAPNDGSWVGQQQGGADKFTWMGQK